MKNCSFKLILLISFIFISNTIKVRAQFTNGNLIVLKVGNGTDTLINLGNACYLQEYSTSGTLVNTIPLAVSGANPVCISGSATSEGQLSRSPDGSLLSFAAYKISPPYTSSLANSTSALVNRVVVKVNHNGTVSIAAATSTAFSANNIRTAVSDAYGNYWAAGGTTGVYHFGSTAADTAVVSNTSTNIRYLSIFNNQLYYVTNKGTFGLYKVGNGIPTNSGQLSTNILATGATSSPFAFSINATSDICYIADDRAISAGGGIQKWINNAGVWTLAYTLGCGNASTVGCRSITVNWSGTSPVIYATTAESSNNRIIKITDNGSTATASTLATSSLNTLFRGLAFTPENNVISDNIPNYSISQVKGVNSQGEADSNNVYCRLTAVVHGINYSNTGLSFYMMDANSGINIYHSSSTFAYNVTEGDRIRVIGRIQQNRGLIQIVPDSIVKLSSGNSLNTAQLVTSLNDNYESMLIKMDNLVYISGWPTIAGPTATVTALKGNDTVLLTIFTQCSLQGTAAPTASFKITGIESQYSNTITPPFNSGYMIFPRYISDLMITSINDITPDASAVKIYPNPSKGKFEVETNNMNSVDVSIFNLQGSIIHQFTDEKPVFSIDISDYESGFYFIRITDRKTMRSFVNRLIIQ
ncbi:MAG: T9SS type A sorting domain-containing protein [Bacteroidales bacterium]